FSYYLTPENFFWLCLLYIGGLVLIVFDIKLMNHGMVALIGIVLMIASLAVPAPSLMLGTLVSLAFIIGLGSSFIFLKVFSPRDLWSKLTLKDQLTDDKGYNSINTDYRQLVGQQGRTTT